MQANLNLQPSYCAAPPFIGKVEQKPTAAQRLGLRYEQHVFQFCRSWASKNNYSIKVQPWISYRDVCGDLRYCQPDVLLFSNNSDNLIVVESKLRHTRGAFAQLLKYKDMLLLLHPSYTTSLIEVCKYFDIDELAVEVLPELRPHNYSKGAAVIWEPEPCLALN